MTLREPHHNGGAAGHGCRGETVPRGKLGAALRLVDRDRVVRLGEELASRHSARLRSVPKAGLVMLPVRDAVLGEAFNLGEVPLSSAEIEIDVENEDRPVRGGALIMNDDAPLASAIAVCDAVAAHRLAGHDRVQALFNEGWAEHVRTQRMRRQMLDASRVDFALLNDTDVGGGPA